MSYLFEGDVVPGLLLGEGAVEEDPREGHRRVEDVLALVVVVGRVVPPERLVEPVDHVTEQVPRDQTKKVGDGIPAQDSTWAMFEMREVSWPSRE